MVPFGAGTSLEGQVLALNGGVCIDLSQMNAVLRVSVEDLDATVAGGRHAPSAQQASREHRPDVLRGSRAPTRRSEA